MNKVRKVSLYKMNPLQRRLNDWIKGNTATKLVINMPRQTGKSTYFCGLGCEICVNHRDVNLWYCTPYYSQASEIFNQKLLPMLANKGIKYESNKTKLTIYFPSSNSYFTFKSVENFQGLRGASLTHLICDEFAFFRPEVYEQALTPMLDAKGQIVFFVSTPKGLNKFYEYMQLGLDKKQHDWSYFKGNYNEIGNEKQIANIKAKRDYLPHEVYAQEYLGEFVTGSGEVFNNISDIFTTENTYQPTEVNYCGIDLGQAHDRTAMVVLNSRREVLFIKRFALNEQKDSKVLMDVLLRTLEGLKKQYHVKTVIESNFNPAIYDMLKHNIDNIKKFTTTSESKRQIISNLQYHVSMRNIFIPEVLNDADQLKREMLEYQVFPSRLRTTVSYSAPEGGYDDMVMALAIANYQLKKTSNTLIV